MGATQAQLSRVYNTKNNVVEVQCDFDINKAFRK